MTTSSPADFVSSLQYATQTDLGMRRANNQDAHVVVLAEDAASYRARGHVFMVADGMGAHAAGELASKLAVDGVPHLYHHYRDLAPAQALERALAETNAEIHRRGLANPDFHNMGTTASVLVLLPQGAVVGHVGDSRVYRLRGDRLDQLTFDHSLVWELRAAGQLPDNTDLARAIPKNVITRSLGPNPSVAIDLEGPFPLEVGDTFLLCSDGLSGQVGDAEMGSLLAHLPPDQAASVLVDLANLRGGPDNITVLIAKVLGDGLVQGAAPGNAPPPAAPAPRMAVSPATWVVAGICAFLALILWSAALPAPAVAAAVAGVAAVIIGLVMGWRAGHPAVAARGSQRLGKGPHRSTTCRAGGEFLTTLATIVRELRQAADEAQWNVNWNRFEEYQRAAEQAARSHREPDAVRSYAQAISFMMDELRHQQRQQASDSSIR